MNTRTRLIAVVLAALFSTISMASLAFAGTDECYPVPVGGCEEPTGGVLPDVDPDVDDPDVDDPDGAIAPKPDDEVQAAGQDPVVLPQTALAQTGLPTAALLAVVGVTLASGMVLLLTTRRRAR